MRSRAQDDGYHSSDSSDSCPDINGRFILARYRNAKLSDALTRRLDFARAVAELTGVLRLGEYGAVSHTLQAALLTDIDAAVEACSSTLQDRNLVAALVQAARKVLPRAKGNCIARVWKGRAVSLSRQGRRRPAPLAHLPGLQPVSLPLELLEQVLSQLQPMSLAHAACVCREWRSAASGESLWQPFLLQGPPAPQQLQQATACQRFAAAVSGREESALRWCARRVLVAGIPHWHDPEWSGALPLSRTSFSVHYPTVIEVVRIICGVSGLCASSDEEEAVGDEVAAGMGWMRVSPAALEPLPS